MIIGIHGNRVGRLKSLLQSSESPQSPEQGLAAHPLANVPNSSGAKFLIFLQT